jgi:hypothetical protein
MDTYRQIRDDLGCLRVAFYAELETRLFFFVPYERSEYYCEGGPFDPLGKKMEPFAPVNADAPVNPPHECVQQEVGKTLGCVLPALRLVQFLPNSPDATDHARHGCGDRQPRLGDRRTITWLTKTSSPNRQHASPNLLVGRPSRPLTASNTGNGYV